MELLLLTTKCVIVSRSGDDGDGGDDGVGCQSLSPAASAFRIRPTILRPRPLSPTLGRHLPGEKSTQQELEGPGRLYVRSPEQGCARLICLSFFCSFYKKKQKKNGQVNIFQLNHHWGMHQLIHNEQNAVAGNEFLLSNQIWLTSTSNPLHCIKHLRKICFQAVRRLSLFR